MWLYLLSELDRYRVHMVIQLTLAMASWTYRRQTRLDMEDMRMYAPWLERRRPNPATSAYGKPTNAEEPRMTQRPGRISGGYHSVGLSVRLKVTHDVSINPYSIPLRDVGTGSRRLTFCVVALHVQLRIPLVPCHFSRLNAPWSTYCRTCKPHVSWRRMSIPRPGINRNALYASPRSKLT